MAGEGEGTAGMSVFMATLRIGSHRWSEHRCISQDTTRSEQNPLLFVANGKLQLIHTAQTCRDAHHLPHDNEPYSMQWTGVIRRQERGLTRCRWSPATDLIEEPAFCRHPPHLCMDGSWRLPIYRSSRQGNNFGFDHSHVALLDESGSFTGTLVDVPHSRGRVQGSIVTSSDGRSLLQFFRSRLADRIYLSTGSLDGLEWSAPVPTTLPNNNSSIQALRLRSGRLAMVFNRFCLEAEPVAAERWGEALWPKSRWPLSLALSEDDGQTWPWMRDIDQGLGFCGTANWDQNAQLAYPTMVEGRSGELHVAYSWHDRVAIRYMYFNEQDIIAAEPYA